MLSQPKPAKPVRGNRQRQRTRTALLQAGQRLLATRPIEGITIDDIVNEADVAKGSFYNHFEGKEELASELLMMIQGDSEFHVYSANANIEDAPERIARALCVILQYGNEHPERIQALLNITQRGTMSSSPLNVGVVSDIRQGIEKGRLSGIDEETGVLVVLGLVWVSVMHLTQEDFPIEVEHLAVKMGTAMLHGLGLDREEAGQIAQQAAADILTPA